MYAGSILVSAVNEKGQYQVSKLDVGDVWYFPKGEAHTVQGVLRVSPNFTIHLTIQITM